MTMCLDSFEMNHLIFTPLLLQDASAPSQERERELMTPGGASAAVVPTLELVMR